MRLKFNSNVAETHYSNPKKAIASKSPNAAGPSDVFITKATCTVRHSQHQTISMLRKVAGSVPNTTKILRYAEKAEGGSVAANLRLIVTGEDLSGAEMSFYATNSHPEAPVWVRELVEWY